MRTGNSTCSVERGLTIPLSAVTQRVGGALSIDNY